MQLFKCKCTDRPCKICKNCQGGGSADFLHIFTVWISLRYGDEPQKDSSFVALSQGRHHWFWGHLVQLRYGNHWHLRHEHAMIVTLIGFDISIDGRTVYELFGHQMSKEYAATLWRRMSFKNRHSLVSEKYPYFWSRYLAPCSADSSAVTHLLIEHRRFQTKDKIFARLICFSRDPIEMGWSRANQAIQALTHSSVSFVRLRFYYAFRMTNREEVWWSLILPKIRELCGPCLSEARSCSYGTKAGP